VETTNPINGNDLGAVAENLILETPTNPEEPTEETVEATDDNQTEMVEEVDEDQDDIGSSDDVEFADDEDVEVEEPEVQEEPTMFTVKVDGEEREVDLEELTRGYSGQKYIQKGMAENAETKKQLEQVQQQMAQERQAILQMAQQLQQGDFPFVPEYPSEELRKSDPLGYLDAEADYRRAMEARKQWEEKTHYMQQRQQQEQERLHQENLNQQAMRLAEWMPEMKDPEKRSAMIMDITTKAKKHYELTDEQISTVRTAEEVMILNDALRWRELQASKATANKKAEGARPVVKPSAKRAQSVGKATRAKKAKAQMQKDGSIDNVANYLLS
jgi:hypothetical protein